MHCDPVSPFSTVLRDKSCIQLMNEGAIHNVTVDVRAHEYKTVKERLVYLVVGYCIFEKAFPKNIRNLLSNVE